MSESAAKRQVFFSNAAVAQERACGYTATGRSVGQGSFEEQTPRARAGGRARLPVRRVSRACGPGFGAPAPLENGAIVFPLVRNHVVNGPCELVSGRGHCLGCAHPAQVISKIALTAMEALGAHPQRERPAVLGWSRTGGKNLRAADLRVRAQAHPR